MRKSINKKAIELDPQKDHAFPSTTSDHSGPGAPDTPAQLSIDVPHKKPNQSSASSRLQTDLIGSSEDALGRMDGATGNGTISQKQVL